MDERDLRLDGNAAASLLHDAFANELTTARGACASCGAEGELGAQHLYMYPHAPGAVLRCHGCESALMVIVHGGGRFRLGLQGLVWLEIKESAGSLADEQA